MSDELSPTASPLAEADPASLNKLIAERINDAMNRPPLSVDDTDLECMIEYYQRERVRFKAESTEKEQRPRGRSAKKVPTSVKEALDIAALPNLAGMLSDEDE